MSGGVLPGALAGHRVIPVLVIDDAARAADVVGALVRGGVNCVEITLRTPAAVDAIRAAVAGTDAVVGAGTVLDPVDVDRVADAGARFVVSPGFDPAVVGRCQELGLVVLPGAASATEVMAARREGLSVVKFFPADRLGGLGTISAIAAPLSDMGFVPSGGVSLSNMGEYLSHPAVPAVSGSWLTPSDLVRRGDADGIELLARTAMDAAAGAPS